MKKIGFIGVYDKTDMLINVAKILTLFNNKVLLIDSTNMQKAKYVVPTINPTVSYITSFEDIDIAVGFKSLEDIKRYIGVSSELPYDIVLVDCDCAESIDKFELRDTTRNYFVTAFDMYSMRKGLEILAGIDLEIELGRILFSKSILKEDREFLEYLSSDFKIKWDRDCIYFPTENGDMSVIAENQRVEKIKFRRLSVEYKDSIGYLVAQILEGISDTQIRKVIKALEKGV